MSRFFVQSSWPTRVVRRWLNIKSISLDQSHSDCTTKVNSKSRLSINFEKPSFYQKRRWRRNEENERTGSSQLSCPVTNSVDIPMFVGTWNVGGNSPDVDLNLKDWLRTNSPADIYVLRFQEIVPLTAGNVLGLGDGATASKWLSLIHQALNEQHLAFPDSFPFQYEFVKNRESSFRPSSSSRVQGSPGPPQRRGTTIQHGHWYHMAGARQMVGIFLCVWVREDVYRHVSSFNVSRVGTGVMGCLGDKGSVSISMTLHHTSLCFVCTHLASGEKEGDAMRRNSDVMGILKRTRFSKSTRIRGKSDPPTSILDHDNIIWLGDLNYRLASVRGDTYDLLERKNWQALFQKDQLRIEQKADRVFKGWEEGEISYAPTYKYSPDSDQYMCETTTSKKKRRTPAWCDRILWKGQGLKQLGYIRGESRFSDHRPVVSLFTVQVNLHNT